MVLSEKEKLFNPVKTIVEDPDRAATLCAQLKNNAKAKMSLFVWEGFESHS